MQKKTLLLVVLNLVIVQLFAQTEAKARRTPLMGWASWNAFRTDISEDLIKAHADALVKNGLKDAGYIYVNTDDGYFGGRDVQGNLLTHPSRFPNGMAALAKYIHAKGLKAGLYSDAGINTCASFWDKDTIGAGCGLYGHEYKDLKLMLHTWNFDYIKVDWCGGQDMGLDQQARYSLIGKMIRELKPETYYSVCSWAFPGAWVANVGDMWRISGDIRADFNAIMKIVDINADLWRYSTPGHVNDMDMLQVGNGMSYEEDKTHFTMWCIMSSPLLLGNDLRKMSKQTLSIISNKEIIALDQDPMVYQGRRLAQKDSLEVWAKPLVTTTSGQVAVVLLNRNNVEREISFDLEKVGINAAKGYALRDLWAKNNFGMSKDTKRSFKVPAHGVVALKITGTSYPFNIFGYQQQK